MEQNLHMYVKRKKTDHSLQIEQLQREISKLTMRESRIKEAYEAGVDTLEEYKNNKDRLVSDRLELTAALSQLLQEEQAEQPDAKEVLKEIRSVADVLKNPERRLNEAKGNLIRSVVEQIIYDKESGKCLLTSLFPEFHPSIKKCYFSSFNIFVIFFLS